jgi:hypothetical protein
MKRRLIIGIFKMFLFCTGALSAQTIALWLFDEQVGLYPSCVLSDAGPNDYPLILGPGGQMVKGRFGNALEPIPHPPIEFPQESVRFGLTPVPIPEGRSVEPMTWMNAMFCGLITSGEKHLRKEVRFKNPTKTGLNLGDFDWTVEFWYQQSATVGEGVVFEVGEGPRGENNRITRLMVMPEKKGFTLFNQPGGSSLFIPTDAKVFRADSKKWHHLAFVYSAKENQIRHYVNGKRQKLPETVTLKALSYGEEDYFSVGRDGLWKRPIPGRIDELRFSQGQVYLKNYKTPKSFSPDQWPVQTLKKGLPLLFDRSKPQPDVLDLGGRKHLFIDDALVSESRDITFTVNPPRLAGCVIDSIDGPFRKHLSVVEDETGLIRIYYGGQDDYLAVRTSRDGIHWESPDVGHGEFDGDKNYVIHASSGMGNVFIDPNAPAEARWKYVSGFQDRGIHVFYSSDGWYFNRVNTAAIPIRSGSQSNVFYDEQRQAYVGYHRADFRKTKGGKTERTFGMLEVKEIMKPWPFDPVTQDETWEAAKTMRLRNPQPWYLDNGPLTPGGLGIEYPQVFGPDDDLDPQETDMYVPKAMKYPWAPDVYVAFPLMYFHYDGESPLTRQVLMHPDRRRGSGPVETQMAVSRDAVNWKRYARPVYVGIGRFGDHDIHQSYFAHGMIRRNDEIWQYCFSERRYHSTWEDNDENVQAVYRFIQRLDGFVSADTPYDRVGKLVTKPFRFEGNRLVLNIDTDAAGYAQVGFLDENNNPIDGFSVDQCVYINGDFIATQAEWIENPDAVTIPYGDSIDDDLEAAAKLKYTKDVSALEGKTVRLVFRMRGAKLYAMQFGQE